MRLDVLIDDLWCHAKGRKASETLQESVLKTIRFINANVHTEDGKRNLFDFYVRDLEPTQHTGDEPV